MTYDTDRFTMKFSLNRFSLVLIFLSLNCLVVVSVTSRDPLLVDHCFDQDSYDWYLRASSWCEQDKFYHCLQDEDGSQRFYEFCRNPIYISPGKYPTYSDSVDEIIAKDCPANTFQNRQQKSSQFNACYKMVECDERGQLICDNGSKTEDRKCKCDIRKGMVIQIYGDSPSNTMICCPESDRSCDCWDKMCGHDEELNEVYQCVKKCKPNHYRPKWNSECFPVNPRIFTTSKPTESSTQSFEFTVITSIEVPTKQVVEQSNEIQLWIILLIALACIVAVVLFSVFAMYCCCHVAWNTVTTLSCDYCKGKNKNIHAENVNIYHIDYASHCAIGTDVKLNIGTEGERKPFVVADVHKAENDDTTDSQEFSGFKNS